MARRTTNIRDDLFNAQFHVARAAFIVQDAHVFEANERLEDFGRVVKDEGASSFLGHTLSLKHLRPLTGDPQGVTPLKSDEPQNIGD
jgi:hypothetical protein